MLDMMKMMGKFKEAQEKIKKIKEELDTIHASSESGAGLVKVTVNGKKELISIEIDDSILNEKDMVQDLVVAASNNALKEIDCVIHCAGKAHTINEKKNFDNYWWIWWTCSSSNNNL